MSNIAGVEAFRAAEWVRSFRPSAINEMLRLTARPGVVSLALGLPAPDLFPAEVLADCAARAITDDPRALQYGHPQPRVRAQIAEMMRQRGVECRPEQVVMTSGAQQALSILARVFLEPGGQVMAERLTYNGLACVLEPLRPELLLVPTSREHGIDVEAVEDALAAGAAPAFLYVVPEGHNPLGVSLREESRARLVQTARRYGVPIVEDDAYGFLHYGGAPLPALRALDDRWVFYVGSFSKILAPASRVGWIVAPEEMVPALLAAKDACDLDMNTLGQRVVSAFLAGSHLDAHLARLRAEYRARRDLMDTCLRLHFPAEARWRIPASGLFFWVELPPEVDCAALLARAVETERVAFVPGHAYAADGSRYGSHCMRLNFSFSPPEEIEKGVAALGRALRAHLNGEAPPPAEPNGSGS